MALGVDTLLRAVAHLRPIFPEGGDQVTGKQLQRLLDEAGLSQRGAAREIDLNERTMRSYIAGDLEIPKKVEYALRWLAQQHKSGNPSGSTKS